MSWLFEDSTTVIVVGLLIGVILAFVLMKTGRGIVILIMAGVALAVGACVLTEQIVVTERERVEQTIDRMVGAFLADDAAGVNKLIFPQSTQLSGKATRVMSFAKLRELVITDGPHITINELTSPPTAHVDLVIRASGEAKSGMSLYDNYVTRIDAQLLREDDQWLFVEAEQSAPFGQ